MIYPPIVNIAEIFSRKNVNQIIISPGSRSAPLTLAFVRHPRVKTRVIPDERSAAFIALGMALTSGSPVGLICTSGSAALNYFPAIAEAYFQNIPLIILTADRPKEWIEQQDGQTVFQNQVYGNHIKKSFEVGTDFSHKDAVWHTERMISEAINLSMEEPKGPVHINIPLREPLYPSIKEELQYDQDLKIIDVQHSVSTLDEADLRLFINKILSSDKKLMVVGQGNWTTEQLQSILDFSNTFKIPVVGDVLSNTHSIEEVIDSADIFLQPHLNHDLGELQPDLLITFGASVISKNLKIFLRNHKPKEHWHLQEAGHCADTFQSLTNIIRVKAASFFSSMIHQFKKLDSHVSPSTDYYKLWQQKNKSTSFAIQNFFVDKPFSEFGAVKTVLDQLPASSLMHLSNSMTVRYVNFLGLKGKEKVTVYVNRGTSGIDGCTSTAVGAAFTRKEDLVVLITGDMAFFYDRNAFWHNYPLANLRVVILNNHGGGIFGLIDGPGELPEREEYFETTQKLNAANTAKDFDLDYCFCTDQMSLETLLKNFFKPSEKGKIMEIETNKIINRDLFNQFKNYFKDRI